MSDLTIFKNRFTIEVQSKSEDDLHSIDIDNVYSLSTIDYKEAERINFVKKWYLINKITAYYVQSNHDHPKYYVRLCQLKIK